MILLIVENNEQKQCTRTSHQGITENGLKEMKMCFLLQPMNCQRQPENQIFGQTLPIVCMCLRLIAY